MVRLNRMPFSCFKLQVWDYFSIKSKLKTGGCKNFQEEIYLSFLAFYWIFLHFSYITRLTASYLHTLHTTLYTVGKRIETTPTKQCLSGFDFAVIQGYVIGTGHHAQGEEGWCKTRHAVLNFLDPPMYEAHFWLTPSSLTHSINRRIILCYLYACQIVCASPCFFPA